jgi:predicted small lipoprotein YifL
MTGTGRYWMLRTGAALALCATLAACGVDGEPETPTRAAHAPAGAILMATRTDPARVFVFFRPRRYPVEPADLRAYRLLLIAAGEAAHSCFDRLTWKRSR